MTPYLSSLTQNLATTFRRASFADSPVAVLPAACWIFVMGAAFAYSFQLIAKTCSLTYSVTFREAWEDSK